MEINQSGLDLIKRFEGFRARAYRDAVGVWTIGYGHTSMAGAPRVVPGMRISRQQAESILARDIERFARQIRPLIAVRLNHNQFSALLSFAYNVGVGNFRRSSVLHRVNARRFDAVPHRLSLWVKAGGRTLKGLVRRRAAEGELFLTGKGSRQDQKGPVIEPVPGKSPHQSTTNLAAIFSAIAGLISTIRAGITGNLAGYVFVGIAVVIIAATFWIMRERWKKTRQEGV